jgi:predicted transcriptional regulator
MDIAKLCRRDVVTVAEGEELVAAARIMRERHIGYLIVVRPEVGGRSVRPVGVLTDRDIVIKVVAMQIDPQTLTVSDVMTQDPLAAAETDSVAKALGHMRRIGVRRLPIVGVQGQLVGVLSLDDVLENMADELNAVAGSIRNEQRIEGALRS